ncbi:MAG TPA: DEAD/DEAH box helicase [Thermoanaerobaculia bacterium]|nr:DEAD/DEAH box helicase [Thermoanaerobaculia bacterium]
MQTVAIPQHPVLTTDQTFAALGLSEPILRLVQEIGFLHPTPIQAAVIPVALEGRDLIGLAETGSGKTAAFALPLAERLTHGQGLRGLILSPTREIALQTKAFLDLFGGDHHLSTVCLIGGVKMGPQIHGLRRRPDIVVATPGRLYDHLERGNVRLDEIEALVLDEADHMLDLGFLPQVQRILQEVPDQRQTLMFSATMPPIIERLAQRFMHDPVVIDITPEGKAAQGISHRLYLVDPENKKALILALLRQELGSTLVFIRRKSDAEWLAGVLEREGHPVERIHSNLSQGQRVQALQGFREGEHRILVATDIAARGIDVEGISHVVNYDLPNEPESYVHRIGRTARAGASGIAISLCDADEMPYLRSIEKLIRMSLPATDRRTGPVRTAQPATPAGHNRSRPKGQDRHRGGERQGQPRNGQPRNAQRNAQRNGQPNSTRPNPNRGKPKPAHSGPARGHHARAGQPAVADQPINDISRVAFLNREIEPRRNSEQRRIADRPE